MKLALIILAIVFTMGVVLLLFKKTPMFQHMANQPFQVVGVLSLTNKAKLVTVESDQGKLLIGVTDHNVTLVKDLMATKLPLGKPAYSASNPTDTSENINEVGALFDSKLSQPPIIYKNFNTDSAE